jgi:S1-C subfamily serine protease
VPHPTAAPLWRLLLVPVVLLAACQRDQPTSLPNFADLVEKASPSVVNISAIAAPGEDVAGRGDTPLDEFFRPTATC